MKSTLAIAALFLAMPMIASATPALKTLTCGIWEADKANSLKPDQLLVVPVKALTIGKDVTLMADQKATAYNGQITIEVGALQADGTKMAPYDTVQINFGDKAKGISFIASGSGMGLLTKQTANEDTAFVNYIEDDPNNSSQAGLQVRVECKLK